MSELPKNTQRIKDTIQDSNINFLIGSGMSAPYLSTLGNIEQLITDIEADTTLEQSKKTILVTSLYRYYFNVVIQKNINILNKDTSAEETIKNYSTFLKIINSIILKRKNTILNKHINIFTTNIDIFLEKSLEKTNVEFSDGFKGRFDLVFDMTNFKKSCFIKSLHYDNTSELPVFNLMKIHGSLTWKKEDEHINFSSDLNLVKSIESITIDPNKFLDISKIESEGKAKNEKYKLTADELKSNLSFNDIDASIINFQDAYKKLAIINPTTEKFRDTVLNQTYYELLRVFSNELEKENTILFVMGFSFADQHIRKIAVRAANSNPTLMIYIFCRTKESKERIETEINKTKTVNNNIQYIVPSQKINDEKEEVDEYEYNLENISKNFFYKILLEIDSQEEEVDTGNNV